QTRAPSVNAWLCKDNRPLKGKERENSRLPLQEKAFALNAADLWINGSAHPSVTVRSAPPGRGSAIHGCPERTPTQRGTKARGKCAGPDCRRYFDGCWTLSSILASPRFSSKSPILLLVPVRLVPCVSEFASGPLLLLGSCSTLRRRCVCWPP